MDSYLTDISPLPQLIAILLLASSGMIIIYVLTDKKEVNMWQLIALVPLALSPYFLECISYKFDSPYMAISIWASVMPLLFYKRKGIGYPIAVLIGTLIVCTTYQVATGIFPMLVVLISLIRWNRKDNIKAIFQYIFVSAFAYVLGLGIFRVFLMKHVRSYVSNSVPDLDQIVPETIKHLGIYFGLVKSDLKIEWLVLIGGLCVAFVYVIVRDSKKKKIWAFLMGLIGVAAMALLSFGIYPLLEEPLYHPRAMYGFGVFVTLVGVYVASACKVYPAKIISVVLSWAFFVFAFTYGNALSVQAQYTDFRITMVINDLKDMDIFMADNAKVVQLNGSIGQSPILQNMPQDYQILNRLVPITFGDSTWDWGQCGFSNYYGLENLLWDPSDDLAAYDLPVLKDTIYHTIRGNEEFVLIELK